MNHSLSNILNRFVKFKEKAKKQNRFYDETVFRIIELKLIKRINNSDEKK